MSQPDDATRSQSGSRAAKTERACADCRKPTTLADPEHAVPCCARCLRRYYPAWEYRELVKSGGFDRERVYAEHGVSG